jgi:hypothetical protein
MFLLRVLNPPENESAKEGGARSALFFELIAYKDGCEQRIGVEHCQNPASII